MPNWLANIIVVAIITFLFLILLGVACIKFDYRLTVERHKVEQLEKDNKHKQELLDAYGIKEITIGGEDNERD